MVPAAGAGSSMSTLSVEISTTVSPSSTVSPTLTAHSKMVPSVTDSPPAGVVMSMISPGASMTAASADAPLPLPSLPLDGDPPPSPAPAAISASTEPTCTVSPSAKWIATMVPLAGAGTSASTLSVETSTRISSASMVSPTCLCHSRMVPSVTDSPMAGKVT